MLQKTKLLQHKGKYILVLPIIFIACTVLPGFVQATEYRVSTTDIAYPARTFAIRFMTRVYAELGHTLTILEYPSERALIESNNGSVDAELFRVAGINKKYKNLIQVPGAISFSQILAYVKKGSKLTPNKWTDLKGLRVGYVIGAKIVERKLPGTGALGVQKPEQLFDMLKNGRLDVAVYADTTMKFQDEIIPIETPLLKVPVYHYIHIKHSHLLAPLQDSIRRLTEQGELMRIISSSKIESTPTLK